MNMGNNRMVSWCESGKGVTYMGNSMWKGEQRTIEGRGGDRE